MGRGIQSKLCWNCEEEVSIQMEKCPYCGSPLNIPSSHVHTKEDSHYEAYPPLYQSSNPFSPYMSQTNNAQQEAESPSHSEGHSESELGSSSPSQVLLPLLFLLPGSTLLFFGTLLLFFG